MIAAVTLDFFGTLVRHRHGRGRGALLGDYCRAQGWRAAPWRHAVLYDLFAAHADEYDPDAAAADQAAFQARVARTLLALLAVDAGPDAAARHAPDLWRIVGPDSLETFSEVPDALRRLRAAGYRIAIVSNWQRGLRAFCRALGIAGLCDAIVASADVGAEKPDGRIFAHACDLLGVAPARVLHVGDGAREDVEGARLAGMRAILLRRDAGADDAPDEARSLADVASFLTRAERSS